MSETQAKSRRRWFRFGLRTMFVVASVASVAFSLGWFGGRAHLRNQQAEEDAAFEEEGSGNPFEEEVDYQNGGKSSTQSEKRLRAERARLQFEKTLDKADWNSPVRSDGSGFF